MEKKLKPSLKENKRYLLVETEASRHEIENAVLEYLGSLGYAKAGIMFVDDKTIAVNREEVDKVRAALCAYHKLIRVARVSGTLKKLRKG
jgi:RNase P/RNase MRP subunit POP5